MTDNNIDSLQTITLLTRDTMKALKRDYPGGITDNHARYLVDEYYLVQEGRIRNGNRSKGLERDAIKSGQEAEPHDAISRFANVYGAAENNIKTLLTW
jgi:hypothetical protein